MLKGYRFFLVNVNRKAPGSDMKNLIQRGGGTFEYLDIHSGKSIWHKALVRGTAKEGQKLVLVGDQESLKTAVSEREWQDLMHEVEMYVCVIMSDDVQLTFSCVVLICPLSLLVILWKLLSILISRHSTRKELLEMSYQVSH